MNPGDLVVSYTIDWSEKHDVIYRDFGIILEGSWSLGRFRVFFSEGGVKWVTNYTVRRVAIYR